MSAASEIAAGTGLNAQAVDVWVKCEGGPADNPFNIGPGKHPGIAGTIAEINNGSNWGGIRATVGADAATTLAAIKASPWDAGHYANGCLDRTLGSPIGGGAAPASGGGGGGFDIGQMLKDAINASLGAFFGRGTFTGFVLELMIRVLEIVAGAIIMAVGFVIVLDVVSTPGTGQGTSLVRSAVRKVKRGAEQAAMMAAMA